MLDNDELRATRKLNGLNDNLYKENNIEEDISILEERIFNYELSIKIGSKDKMISTSIKENEAIKHLLEERKQDKKRIKELEDENKRKDTFVEMAKEVIENSILIDKIKNKIDDLKEQRRKLGFKTYLRREDMLNDDKAIVHKISVLQELLEENSNDK